MTLQLLQSQILSNTEENNKSPMIVVTAHYCVLITY
jgi:hypothetical protein